MGKAKYYVVWKGAKPGIYNTWDECSRQIAGFPKALYKSFETGEAARRAFTEDPYKYIGQNTPASATIAPEKLAKIGRPIGDSISVDGAWNTATGVIEYRGVYTKTGEELFRKGPYQDGTNNIAEFLAIVHGLAFCKKQGLTLPIYSDSRNAIAWVMKKEFRTNHPKSKANGELFDMADRAITWLYENKYPNKILKWETKAWGENPADFGRK
ncbi:MAG: ribonuclease H [Sphingobacteriales bacterium]|nr:MAG: ribonuclease H [Sphingobacteriales bacterium]